MTDADRAQERPGAELIPALGDRAALVLRAPASLVGGLDTDAVLQALLADARDATGAESAAVAIDSESGDGIERLVFSGPQGSSRSRTWRPGDPTADGGGAPGPAPLEFELKSRGERLGTLFLFQPSEGLEAAGLHAAELFAPLASIAVAEHRLRERLRRGAGESERASRALEASTSMARAVGGVTELDRVLGTIARRARALVEARTVLVLLGEHSELEIVVATGEFERSALGSRLELGGGWGRVLRSEGAERIGPGEPEAELSARELGVDARAALIAPLRFRGRRLGVIAAFDRLEDGPEFDPDDAGLMVSFATSAATAVATAQSVAADRLRNSIESSERERGRWARELHDETLQGLGALRLLLSAALGRDEAQLRSRVSSAVEQLETEIANLRGLIAELRPGALDQLGLADAIEGLADHHRETTGIDVEATVGTCRDMELDPELESGVYRVVQEALTNVAKHARASHVSVAVECDGQALRLEVADDGAGFDTGDPNAGFGLLGMRERVELAGGSLELESAPGVGTRLAAELPLATPARR
ncbi:GAF domain-containing sensor histidine kinase [Thermoleophilia bacterium SCSIO 60948]|nr:GAF domain-containing sensor histidine kinase [Thermoleophilia bacterium SCSIO 60948]